MGWHIVLTRDGTILEATGGAPVSWIGARLDDCHEAPDDLKQAAAVRLRSNHSAAAVSAAVPLQSTGDTVCLTVIDALPLHRTPTNLSALLRSSLESVLQQARAADVSMKVVIDQRVPAMALVDGDKIAWAVTALAGNALRYVRRGSMMMPSGSITVRAMYNSVGSEVIVEVQDDGPGIPPDKLRAIFGLTPDGPRLALGLQMIREVVAAHGGHLEVESQTDAFVSGTVVRLTLPVS